MDQGLKYCPKSLWPWIRHRFLRMLETWSIMRQMDKFYFFKIKTSASWKTLLWDWKDKARSGKRCLQNAHLTRLVSRISNKFSKLNSEKINNPVKFGQKTWADIPRKARRWPKSTKIFNIISPQEMQFKATVRYCYPSLRITKMRTADTSQHWQSCSITVTLIIACANANSAISFKKFGSFLWDKTYSDHNNLAIELLLWDFFSPNWIHVCSPQKSVLEFLQEFLFIISPQLETI